MAEAIDVVRASGSHEEVESVLDTLFEPSQSSLRASPAPSITSSQSRHSSTSSSSSSSVWHEPQPPITQAGVLAQPFSQKVGGLVFTQPAGAKPMTFSLGSGQPAYPRTVLPPNPSQQRVLQAAAAANQLSQARQSQREQIEPLEISEEEDEEEEEERPKKKQKKARTTSKKTEKGEESSSGKRGRKRKESVGALGQYIYIKTTDIPKKYFFKMPILFFKKIN